MITPPTHMITPPARNNKIVAGQLEALAAARKIMGMPTKDIEDELRRVWAAPEGAAPGQHLHWDRARELDRLSALPRVAAYASFNKILGVGPATIEKWIGDDIMTVSVLRRAVSTARVRLTHMQELGLKYYADLATRIPRAEVEAIAAAVQAAIREAASEHMTPIFTIAGSYRRGKQTSGDIDIIVAGGPSIEAITHALKALPEYVDTVIAGAERLTILYKGAVCRQIDILAVDLGTYPLALAYFTGGFVHNEWLRGVAKSQGMRLNQASLTRHGADGQRENIPVASEEDLYRILGCAWVEPTDRE